MAAPSTASDLVSILRKSRLLSEQQLGQFLQTHAEEKSAKDLGMALQAEGLLTRFQAEQILKGRHKGFVLGKYTLLERIGMGGMGQVYQAEHTAMRRRVAIKVLPPDRGQNEFARERFLREARAAAAIEHPNIIRAYDVEMEGDVAFLVMEFVDGVNLHDLVARKGPLAPARAAYYLWQIANGLSAVHERALVHRDIKPANLLLDRSGVVRILDLGLVRSQLDDDALTRGEGAKVVGTADYLAPEQAINCSNVDGRADLYSLGCTAYYLLTGEPPFAGDKISAKLLMHQTREPKPVHIERPGIPVGLSNVVHRLLSKKPSDRYESAIELMRALEPWATEPISLPAADDFPASADALRAPQSITNQSRVSLGSLPAIHGNRSELSGSAIRFYSDPNPIDVNGLGQANQPTATTDMHDTLPVDQPTVKPTVVSKKPEKPLQVDVRIGANVPVPSKQSSVKAAASAQPSEIQVPQMNPVMEQSAVKKMEQLFGVKAIPSSVPKNQRLKIAAIVGGVVFVGVLITTLVVLAMNR